jgi:hypothetical protein
LRRWDRNFKFAALKRFPLEMNQDDKVLAVLSASS